MGEQDVDPLALRIDPETAAGKPGVAEGVASEPHSARAVGALPAPAESVGAAARERAVDARPRAEPPGSEPLARQDQQLIGGQEEAGMSGQKAQRAGIAVLRATAQKRRLTGERNALFGGELDLASVVEPALDNLLLRRRSGQRANRRQAERLGHVQVEEIGEAPAGRSLGGEAPEQVAQITVGRAGGCALVALRPEAFGQE